MVAAAEDRDPKKAGTYSERQRGEKLPSATLFVRSQSLYSDHLIWGHLPAAKLERAKEFAARALAAYKG